MELLLLLLLLLLLSLLIGTRSRDTTPSCLRSLLCRVVAPGFRITARLAAPPTGRRCEDAKTEPDRRDMDTSFDVHRVNFYSPELLSVQCMAVEGETRRLAVGR